MKVSAGLCHIRKGFNYVQACLQDNKLSDLDYIKRENNYNRFTVHLYSRSQSRAMIVFLVNMVVIHDIPY